MATPQAPTTPALDATSAPALAPETFHKRKDSLEKAMAHRPDAKDLQARHILHDTSVAPSLQSAAEQLDRQRATDSLKKGLAQRPDRDELVGRNILPDSSAAPALQEKQRELERRMRADQLERELARRPSPERLVKEGILTEKDAEEIAGN